MVSQHALETAVYDQVRTKPCTRVHGRPTFENYLTLKRECQEPSYGINVGYHWCGDLGLSPVIVGAAAHQIDTGLAYVEEL